MTCLGGRRHRPAAGTSAAWLAAAVVCCVACCVVFAVEGYEARMFGIPSNPATNDPVSFCMGEQEGFLPNLINQAKDKEMQDWVVAVNAKVGGHAAVSGTTGDSPCTSDATCIWKWVGGPLAANPLMFFIGIKTNAMQDPVNGFYHRWKGSNVVTATTGSLTSVHLNLNEGWCAQVSKYTVGAVICEVLVTPEPTAIPTPTPSEPTSTTPLPSSTTPTTEVPFAIEVFTSPVPWWIGVIIAVGVVFLAILTALFFSRFLNGWKKTGVDDDATDAQDFNDDGDYAELRQPDRA